jgi:thiol:disulfide interchange protein DsbC
MKSLLAAVLAAFLAVPAVALAQAEAKIKQTLEERFKAKIDGVTKTPYMGLYEVRSGDIILYTDENVAYLIHGSIIDGKTRENLTETRKEALSVISWKDLPLADAVKTVRGNGSRQLAVFADPNCGYCKKFEQQLQSMNDVTIYTFLYPILAPDSIEKSVAIWCSKDRSKAYYDLMLKGVPPSAGSCDTPVQKNVALGQKLNIDGTPTTFMPTGQRIVGARFDAVQRAIEKSGK